MKATGIVRRIDGFRMRGHPEGDPPHHENTGGSHFTENIDTRFGVLYERGIGEGTVHREVNLEIPQSDCTGCGFCSYAINSMILSPIFHRIRSDSTFIPF